MNRALFTKGPCIALAFASIGQAFAQEVPFADYIQPAKDMLLGYGSSDTSNTFDNNTYSYAMSTALTANGFFGKGLTLPGEWPVNGDPEKNGSRGFGVSIFGSFPKGADYLDLMFYYKPESGAPCKFRVDIRADPDWHLGSTANGGVINLTGAIGEWSRVRIRRLNTSGDEFGDPTNPSSIRIVALQNPDRNFPGFGGSYNQTARIFIDNVRLSVPRRLNGLYKVTGTTNKNVGTVTFNQSGGLLQFNDWVQNLGNVDIVNCFGFPNLGYTTTTSYSSNLIYTYLDSGSVRQFGRDRFATNLNSVANNEWIGTGVTGNAATDKFWGFNGQKNLPNRGMILRQVTTSVYSHYIRNINSLNGYAAEVPINLGNEQVVAVADVSGDGVDDIITRVGTTLRARTWSNESGSWPSTIPTFAAPVTYSTYGYLKCLVVADINDDGVDDLLMSDSASGDVFSLITTPTGSNLKWLFTLNASQKEKVYAVTDADNDGYPDIYTTRQRTTDSVGEINIRKPVKTGTSISSVGTVAEFNYDAYKPCAIGDINGDGSSDVVMLKNDSPFYSVATFMVNPANRALLNPPTWICSAGTPTVRPIHFYGPN